MATARRSARSRRAYLRDFASGNAKKNSLEPTLNRTSPVVFHARRLLLLASVALTPAALAQGSSVLTGTLIDASSKNPISDVVVTATSPKLQGEQIVVSDSTGTYRIPQLPPGPYTLRFEKESFKPYTRSDVQLRIDQTVRVNVELLPDALTAEVITVVGRAPTVDVGSTTTGINIGSEYIKNLALVRPGGKGGASRSFESLAEIAPGATADAYGISVNGTTSPENQFVIDGLSVNDPSFGLLGTPLSVEFVQEVNVITGGFMPEYGRATGGVMNVVTKSGSNEFHGSVWGSWTPGALEGARAQVKREGSVVSTQQALGNIGDFGVEIGGPILKDKLWFFAGVGPSFTRRILTRSLNAIQLDGAGNVIRDDLGFSQTTPIPGTATNYFGDERSLQYIAKLTYLLNPDHNLSVSVYGTPTSSGGPGKIGINPRTGGLEATNLSGQIQSIGSIYQSAARDVSAKWSSSFLDKHLLVDATFGWHHQDYANLPSDGSEPGSNVGESGNPYVLWGRSVMLDGVTPNYHTIRDFEDFPNADEYCEAAGTMSPKKCPVLTYSTGGFGYIDRSSLDRYQARVVSTLLANLLGHHVIKAGVDFERMSYYHKKAYTGRVAYAENLTGTRVTDTREFAYLTAPDSATISDFVETQVSSNTIGGFLQDSWNVADVITLNAGLRYDTQQLFGSDGSLAITLANQISPRIGVVYDFTQSGRSKIFANYARFYENMPLEVIDRGFPPERQVNAGRFLAANANRPGCNPLDPVELQTKCRSDANLRDFGLAGITDLEDPNRRWLITGGDPTPVDPGLQPQSSDEFVVGGEYEVISDGRVGVTYTRRNMNRVIEDMSNDEATSYFIGNPGYGIAADFPKATRDYDGVTVFFNKAFSDLWLGQVSYTYSNLRGNYSGLFRPETNQLTPNANATFDLKSLLANGTGPLPGESTHSFKAYGAKEFVLTGAMSLTLGVTYRGRSGNPINYLGAHEVYGSDEAVILPRGSGGRTPWVHAIDTRLAFNWKFGGDRMATVGLDVFNLFNFQAATIVEETYTRDFVRPIPNGTQADLASLQTTEGLPAAVNPNFKNPLQFQAPRNVRFGVKVAF